MKKLDWKDIQKWLSTPNPLKSLLEKIESKERNYSDAQLKKILEFIQQNGLRHKLEEVKKCSKAAHVILHWSLLIV